MNKVKAVGSGTLASYTFVCRAAAGAVEITQIPSVPSRWAKAMRWIPEQAFRHRSMLWYMVSGPKSGSEITASRLGRAVVASVGQKPEEQEM